MINPDQHLAANLFDAPENAPTRNGFGEGLVQAADLDEKLVALCADLTESTRMETFAKKYPARFIEMGVAEQNLATVASGMANYGKIPFITSYAAFSPGRNWEQIRTTIALNNVPVQIVGSHVGLQTGPDGATHQMLEDIALMRAMPNMVVLSPADSEEARKATLAMAKLGRPAYMRVARDKTPIMTTPESPFEIGKANVVWKSDSPRAAIFATGPLLYQALLAARDLEKEGIMVTVINVHTIKPIDRETIVREAKSARAVVTVEEHQIHGGLGGAIAEVLAAESPAPIEFVAMRDEFGQSGEPQELIEHYGLDAPHIVEAVKKAIARA
jgi:transketolase